MRLFFILMRICRHVLEIRTRKVRILSVLIVIDRWPRSYLLGYVIGRIGIQRTMLIHCTRTLYLQGGPYNEEKKRDAPPWVRINAVLETMNYRSA